MSQYPSFNGIYPSWADFEIIIKAAGMPTFKTLDFMAFEAKETLQPGEVRGAGPVRRGTTIGEYSAEASITFAMLQGQLLRQRLGNIAKLRKMPMGAVYFQINANWKLPGLMGAFIKCEVVNCRIQESAFSGAPGSDPAALVVPINCERVRFGGKSLIEF